MSQSARNKPVRYIVNEPVEIEAGVFLRVGNYTGMMEERGMDTLSKGVMWGAPLYRIELSVEELAGMGRKNGGGAHDISYDLARFITQGQVQVASDDAAEAAPITD